MFKLPHSFVVHITLPVANLCDAIDAIRGKVAIALNRIILPPAVIAYL